MALRYWLKRYFEHYSAPQSSGNPRYRRTPEWFALWLLDGCTHSLSCSPGSGNSWTWDSWCNWNDSCPYCTTCCSWPCLPGTIYRPEPTLGPRSSSAEADPLAPDSGPASDACICTFGSGTRSWPALGWVWAARPDGLSRGRTGTSVAWSAAPARRPAPGRRAPWAFSASSA